MGTVDTGEITGPQNFVFSRPDQTGSYDVGVETVSWTDARGKEMVAEVWYPAVHSAMDEPGPYPEIPISREAVRYASPDRTGAPWPMVAFSHGYQGIRYQSVFLTEHLASHGFVVIAPDHPGNTLIDHDAGRDAETFLERPDDIRAAVDELLRLSDSEIDGPRLTGLVDTEDPTYAVIGHSFGAFSAMVIGGGEIDYAHIQDHCEGDGDGHICGIFPDGVPIPATPYGAADARAVATVPLAPGIWYAFGEGGGGLQGVREPLVVAGNLDQVLDYETEILPCYTAMAGPKRFATLDKAGHYAFTDICSVFPQLFADCAGVAEGWIDIERAQQITRTLVTAHLGQVMRQDERYDPWLGISYTAGQAELMWVEE
jgi:predicted dienelactone hydrolase